MANEILTISMLYPIISGACSLLVSLFGLFSPFICTEREFINDTNWYIAKLRGFRIDKLKGFVSESFNLKISENAKEETQKGCYIHDIYECFADDIEEYISVDYDIRKCLKKYKITNTSFMITLWLSVAAVILSLVFNYVKSLNVYLSILFYCTILFVFVQLINIIFLRYLCMHSQNIYQHKIFRGHRK